LDNLYLIPPYRDNESGSQRKVGFELEFAGISVEETAEILSAVFPGNVRRKSDLEFEVKSKSFGKFRVELDWRLGKQIAKRRADPPSDDTKAADEESQDILLDGLSWLASRVVPVEVVCPPMALDDLNHLDFLVQELRHSGAKGTEDSLVYAFGVHINPEVPSTSFYSIACYLQAFAISQKWLFQKSRVDPARKIMPYINTYPEPYCLQTIMYGREVTHKQLVADYMQYNATRNRALDMLPLWHHLWPDEMQRYALKDTLTQKRPTYHYRLPNCEIEKPGWYLNHVWNLWCVVEYLAAKEYELHHLVDQWRKTTGKGFWKAENQWHETLDRIYNDLLSA
jgi:hypothetical protein